MATAKPPTVSEQLKKVPPAVRPIVTAARSSIKAVAPEAKEVAYTGGQPKSATYMWKLARYQANGENVVGIGTFSKHSSLFFYRGRELDDGKGLLEGSGKDSRFITLRSAADATRPAVRRLLERAFLLSKG
ncbi:MAG TPA: DUF1801 domain-containing protein [Candidatus Dormibacteraeota bacterium]